ncbi:hypothetical protein [Haliangium sp.]|uniref:hypothetical protein n=1 Tax=Haliangium sp. TaxID=2663208 RepID=UPI003D10BC66
MHMSSARPWSAASALTLGILTLFFLGCGDDGPSEPPDAAAPDAALPDAALPDAALPDAAAPDAGLVINLEALCNADDGGYVRFFHRVVECNPYAVFMFASMLSDEALSTACYGQFQGPYDDGTLELADVDGWNACLDYIENAECKLVAPDNPGPCRAVLVGQLALDDPCDMSEQCGSEAYCDRSQVGGGVTCGTCTALKANGTPCQSDSECAGRVCADNGTCRDFGDVGDLCAEDGECLGELVCPANTGRCAVRRLWQVNDACTSFDTDCGVPIGGLYCDEAQSVCRSFLALGDPCGVDTALCNRFAFEYCDQGTNQCTAPTAAAHGEPCGFDMGRTCMDGLLCSNPERGGTCFTVLGVGEDCSNPAQARCGIFLDCSADSNTCVYQSNYTGMCPDAS